MASLQGDKFNLPDDIEYEGNANRGATLEESESKTDDESLQSLSEISFRDRLEEVSSPGIEGQIQQENPAELAIPRIPRLRNTHIRNNEVSIARRINRKASNIDSFLEKLRRENRVISYDTKSIGKKSNAIVSTKREEKGDSQNKLKAFKASIQWSLVREEKLTVYPTPKQYVLGFCDESFPADGAIIVDYIINLMKLVEFIDVSKVVELIEKFCLSEAANGDFISAIFNIIDRFNKLLINQDFDENHDDSEELFGKEWHAHLTNPKDFDKNDFRFQVHLFQKKETLRAILNKDGSIADQFFLGSNALSTSIIDSTQPSNWAASGVILQIQPSKDIVITNKSDLGLNMNHRNKRLKIIQSFLNELNRIPEDWIDLQNFVKNKLKSAFSSPKDLADKTITGWNEVLVRLPASNHRLSLQKRKKVAPLITGIVIYRSRFFSEESKSGFYEEWYAEAYDSYRLASEKLDIPIILL